jgi:hypothetical protein
MAQTKANATYAVTTLNLLTKVMGKLSLVHVAARTKHHKLANGSGSKKSALLSIPAILDRAAAPSTWLKSRKFNALKSP